MTLLKVVILLTVAAMLQMLLPASVPFLLGTVTVLAFSAGRSMLITMALLAALLNDAFSLFPLGLSIPFYLLLVEGIRRVRSEVFVDQLITYLFLGALAALAQTIYFAVILSLGGLRSPSIGELFVRLVTSAVAGGLVAPLIYLSTTRLQKRLRHAWRYIY